MRKIKRLILLFFVLILSFNVYAPNLPDRVIEKQYWNYMRRQSRLRAEEQRARELKRYLDAIGDSESGNNPGAYNKYGYIGKYQFGSAARKYCGVPKTITFGKFIKNPSIWSEQQQDSAMIVLLSKNEEHLMDVIHRYNGKTVNGIVITRSGILAAAHLGGATGVRKYFAHNYNPRDAYGTSIEDYLIKFSGFNF